eukprot:3184484-Pleurochrysis_carterae.AAC.1
MSASEPPLAVGTYAGHIVRCNEFAYQQTRKAAPSCECKSTKLETHDAQKHAYFPPHNTVCLHSCRHIAGERFQSQDTCCLSVCSCISVREIGSGWQAKKEDEIRPG